jgi:hypothetical protein
VTEPDLSATIRFNALREEMERELRAMTLETREARLTQVLILIAEMMKL